MKPSLISEQEMFDELNESRKYLNFMYKYFPIAHYLLEPIYDHFKEPFTVIVFVYMFLQYITSQCFQILSNS